VSASSPSSLSGCRLHVVLVLHPAVSNAGVEELCWYFSRLLVIVEMKGDVKEYLGCSKVLFDCCLFQFQVLFC
jgi:hypothetical protein